MERKNANILLVDDEEADLTAVREALEAEGHSVRVAADFHQALQVFSSAQGEFDLLIVDVSLPGGNGCDLAITIWKQKPGIPVLFISGHVGAEVCRYYGVDVSDRHFLRKPFGPVELMERVHLMLKSLEPPKPQLAKELAPSSRS
jgi:DNA-binding response OmpR family regulator